MRLQSREAQRVLVSSNHGVAYYTSNQILDFICKLDFEFHPSKHFLSVINPFSNLNTKIQIGAI